MVSICANSTCRAPFRYLRAGKLVAVTSSHGKNSCPHSVEHFWLCDSCSQNYDLRITGEGSVKLVARENDAPRASTLGVQNGSLLEALRFELNFLDRGGYRKSGLWSFAEPSFFEDSPLCPNRAGSQPAIPCSQCVLAKFIPPENSKEPRACQSIPLDELGTTLFTLRQKNAPDAEIDSRLRSWLRQRTEECATSDGS